MDDGSWEDFPASFSTSPPPVFARSSPPLGTGAVQLNVPGKIDAFGAAPLLPNTLQRTVALQPTVTGSVAGPGRTNSSAHLSTSNSVLRTLTVPVTAGLQSAIPATRLSGPQQSSIDRARSSSAVRDPLTQSAMSASRSWWVTQAAAAPIDTAAAHHTFEQPFSDEDELQVDSNADTLFDDDLDETAHMPAAFSETGRPAALGTVCVCNAVSSLH